jgi:hypothetical protein
MIRFNIDNASPLPVYLQVRQSILLDVMAGRLADGDRMPSIRELAKILKLNPKSILQFGRRRGYPGTPGQRLPGEIPKSKTG